MHAGGDLRSSLGEGVEARPQENVLTDAPVGLGCDQVLDEAGPGDDGGPEPTGEDRVHVRTAAPPVVGGCQLEADLVVEHVGRRVDLDVHGPAISELPSHYFHPNIFLTFVDEHLGLQRTRDLLGVGNILWSTDFPHPVTSWPNSKQIVADQFEGIPADERELILSGNALRVWNLESTER
jgi:predicted TIM-barrel fold metal-dependent hydrolase